jgi:hypothetical protein
MPQIPGIDYNSHQDIAPPGIDGFFEEERFPKKSQNSWPAPAPLPMSSSYWPNNDIPAHPPLPFMAPP